MSTKIAPKPKTQTQGAPTERDIARLQKDVSDALAELDVNRRPQLSSEYIEKDISLTAGRENMIEHGLGRKYRGWKLVDITEPAYVWRVKSSSADKGKYLVLCSDVDVTVRIEVF